MGDYDGGRDYDSLKKFAEESLKPLCSPSNIDLCDEAKKSEIIALQALPESELSAKADAMKAKIKEAEESFEKAVEELQAKYEELQKNKDDTVKQVKESGLGLVQAVLSAKQKSGGEKAELLGEFCCA